MSLIYISNEMDREDEILQYIEAHLGCTKTDLENGVDMAARTVRKYLKKLMEEDKKVVCIVDRKNPRIHHLFINDQIRLAFISMALSRVEEQMKNQKYTVAQLIGKNGEGAGWAICPHNGGPPVIASTVTEGVKNLIASVNRLKSLL